MQTKFLLFLLCLGSFLFTSCKKEVIVQPEPVVIKYQKVSGTMTFTQKSFEPISFDAQGKATKAKIIQEVSGTVGPLGLLTMEANVTFDLVNNKSEEVLGTYFDKEGNSIKTTSSSVGNDIGITITEKITGGTGKFAKIVGNGSYFITLKNGNGSGVLEWNVSY